MSIFKHIISFLFVCFVCSCAADHTHHYNNVTMGDFYDGTFISDQGLTFDIVEMSCAVDTDTLKRAIISCDILKYSDYNRYEVRLTDFEPVFTKDPIDSTKVNDSALFVDNALQIDEVWYAAGYLNLHLYIPVKEGSKTAHMINLLRNDSKATDGVYEFSFRHNAYGEVITAADTEFIPASTHVSFPISQLFKDNEKKLQVILRWTSYEEQDGKLSEVTQKNATTLDIERSEYEHQHQK